MIELHDLGEGRMQLGYGGDVLNTMVYAARAGVQCQFSTVTGDDHYGYWLKKQWSKEGVGCELVWHAEDSAPALYVIRNDASGERAFQYWRAESPFSRLLSKDKYSSRLADSMRAANCIYLSGITLAMLGTTDRVRLIEMIRVARDAGARVAFDPNYRARLWEGPGQALEVFRFAYESSDVVMPSLADECELRGEDIGYEALTNQLVSYGVSEVVVKDGERGAFMYAEGARYKVESSPVSQVVDTTAAGDSYNGTYLAARMLGESPEAAAGKAASQAAYVIQHRGAIAPSEDNYE